MRICHFADSHLGAGENHHRQGKSGLTVRQEDIINSFVEAVDKIIALKPDICIHAGDLFHTVRPYNRIMALAGQQLYRLAEENGIPTIIIAGNHDAPKQPHIGAALEVYRQIDNLYVAVESKLHVFEVAGAKIFALPHCLTTAILKRELEKCKPDPQARYNVLVMHGVASGMPEFSMADLGEQELPVDVMGRFNYTALGHFHNYCKVGHNAYYSGSTERLSQSERESAKGFIEVELEPFKMTFHEVSSRVMVDVKKIDARGKRGDQVAEIIKEELNKVDSSDKIVRISVEGVTGEIMKTIPAETIAELKQKSFDLNIRFERDKSEETEIQFGRSAIGRLDESFIAFLDAIELEGFDKERLKKEALKYLNLAD